ncbi:NUDIX hydrolase [Saccharopolyspora sp. NPDC000995]
MSIANDHIQRTLSSYLDAHPEDAESLAPLSELLAKDVDVTTRHEYRGHATAGAVLVNAEGRVLHIHHVALDRWLLPGGHLEPGDVSLVDAGLRELCEETGINPGDVVTAFVDPVHIDMHMIPANDRKQEPEHPHFDFRFVFRTTAEVGALQTEEVHNAAWLSPDELTDPHLRERVRGVLEAASAD